MWEEHEILSFMLLQNPSLRQINSLRVLLLGNLLKRKEDGVLVSKKNGVGKRLSYSYIRSISLTLFVRSNSE